MPPKIDLTLKIPSPPTVFEDVRLGGGASKKYVKSPHPAKATRPIQLSRFPVDVVSKKEEGAVGTGEEKTKEPGYPLCQDLRGYVDAQGGWWISCLSIFDELDDNSSRPTKMDRCRKSGSGKKAFAHPLQSDIVPNKRWLSPNKWTDEISSKGAEWMVQAEHVQEFVIWALSKRRITSMAERHRLAHKFDIDTQTVDIPVAIEQSMIDYLKEVLPCHIETQYRMGPYRLDAYLEAFRVAIQIDEHGHAAYDQDGESKMDDFFRKECVVVIRFNPHAKYGMDPKVKLARTVIERLLSPDFVSFRRERGLFLEKT